MNTGLKFYLYICVIFSTKVQRLVILKVQGPNFVRDGQFKMRLDPVVFSKNVEKITSVGSSALQKRLQRLDQPTLAIFFENEKNLVSKKITTMGSQHHLNPIVVFFFEIKFFSFPKKITSVG